MSHALSEWDNEYARLARAASQLRTQGFNNHNSGSGDLQQRNTLQQGLRRLDDSIQALPIAPAEIHRRRRLIQHLQQQQQTMDNNSGNSLSQMQMAMRQQDNMIDELATGVSRLKDQTHMIGEEANMHVNLMSNMETNLDAAHASLEGETRRAAQLKEDQSVWRLQLTVAGLCVLMVLLILMGFS